MMTIDWALSDAASALAHARQRAETVGDPRLGAICVAEAAVLVAMRPVEAAQ